MIQVLRGTSSQRTSHSEVSTSGQPIYETDTRKFYVGDGSTRVNALQPIVSDIPASSQTVLGGVKVYIDSSGYLCIDTE